MPKVELKKLEIRVKRNLTKTMRTFFPKLVVFGKNLKLKVNPMFIHIYRLKSELIWVEKC